MKHQPRPRRPGKHLAIRVALIDPTAQTVVEKTITMDAKAVKALLRVANPQSERLGHANRVDIVLMGNAMPQVAILGGAEPEYQMSVEDGQLTRIFHGRGIVFGFAVAAHKACTIPVTIPWVLERVTWLSALSGQAPTAE